MIAESCGKTVLLYEFVLQNILMSILKFQKKSIIFFK